MKQCPYCAEQIQDDAIKCRYCHESLPSAKKHKWYFRSSIVILAFLSVGPFALPLVWYNPEYSIKKKTLISVVIAVASYFFIVWSIQAFQCIYDYYEMIAEMVK